VNNIVTTVKSDKMLRGSFGLYHSYVAGFLNSAKVIIFYVLCSEVKFMLKNVLPVKIALSSFLQTKTLR